MSSPNRLIKVKRKGSKDYVEVDNEESISVQFVSNLLIYKSSYNLNSCVIDSYIIIIVQTKT